MIGTVLGHYEILEAIGAGGMGEVYRARDIRLDRTVAVKILPPQFADDAERRQRFEREARTISSLSHPGICTLYDLGLSDGTHYLVMEYLDGETLAERIRRGPLPLEDVLRHGAAIADALDRAHHAGIVHRDLKPGNIMLTRDGVKLLDFGLAKSTLAMTTSSILATQAATESPEASPLTAAGTVLGTFQYMAPEQLEGGDADVRSDLFSLGAVLYEMLTGQRAFQGRSQASLIAAILEKDPVAVTALQPMTPPALAHAISRCLEKDPERRWQSARDLAAHLQWISQGGTASPDGAAPARSRRRGREASGWIAAAVLAAAALALLGRQFASGPAPGEPIHFQFTSAAGTRVSSPRISPDGRQIAFTARSVNEERRRIEVRSLDGLDIRTVPGTEGAAAAIWSPDSRRLAFIADDRLRAVPVAGGPVETLAEATRGDDGSWGDRDIILFDKGLGSPIFRVSAQGGVARAASRIPEGGGEGHGWPCFLPGGDRFLCLAVADTSREDGLFPLLAFDTGTGDLLSEVGLVGSRVEYSEGHVLHVLNGSLVAQPLDLRSLELTGDPVPLAEGMRADPYGQADFSVSRNGTLVFRPSRSQAERITLRGRDGRLLAEVGDPAPYFVPAPSPDGRWIAVARIAGPRDMDLWIFDIERGTSSRATLFNEDLVYPLWSPDGRELLVPVVRDREHVIYRVPADGVAPPESLMTFPAYVEATGWTPSGDVLGYARRDSSTDIFLMRPGKPGPVRWLLETPANETVPSLSPDGKWLAYESDESGRSEVYVRSYPDLTRKWQVSTDGGEIPIWTRGGTEIVYLADAAVRTVSIDTREDLVAGTPVKRFDLPPATEGSAFNVFPDGERFVFTEAVATNVGTAVDVIVNWPGMIARR